MTEVERPSAPVADKRVGGAAYPATPDGRQLPPAAQRALAEAEARRRAGVYSANRNPESGGREGPDPARYGDWEIDGIAVDF